MFSPFEPYSTVFLFSFNIFIIILRNYKHDKSEPCNVSDRVILKMCSIKMH